ncbi:MAG: 4Fe-4S dicluster domain-containing protein, partial [Methanobacterium sp.]
MVANIKEVKTEGCNIKRVGEENRELSYKDEICVGCGICENICPVEAIELGSIGGIERTGVDESKIAIDENKCVLCGMCSVGCPVDALDLKIDETSIKEMKEYPSLIKSAEIDDETCIYCKACETACPRDAITIARILPDRSKLVTGEIEIDKETCIDCGICEEMCPADAITMEHKVPTSDDPTVSSDINV